MEVFTEPEVVGSYRGGGYTVSEFTAKAKRLLGYGALAVLIGAGAGLVKKKWNHYLAYEGASGWMFIIAVDTMSAGDRDFEVLETNIQISQKDQ